MKLFSFVNSDFIYILLRQGVKRACLNFGNLGKWMMLFKGNSGIIKIVNKIDLSFFIITLKSDF